MVLMLAGWAVVGGLAGCAPDIEQDPPPEDRPQAIFDSETSTVPLPNDVALEADGTLPDLEGAGEDNAEGQFLSWLGTLHGWLPAQDIELPFDQPLDEETVNSDNVKVFEVGEEGALTEVSLAEVRHVPQILQVIGEDGEPTEVEGAMVVPVPEEPLENSTRYAVVATDGLKGEDGKTVVASQAMFFAASQEPLVDENGDKTIESLPDNETAQTLEGLRQMLAPIFEGAAEMEIPRDSVVAASLWTTVPDPKTVLDPATATLPIPNTAALDEDGTFPDSALENLGENSAQGYFEDYLAQLHSWPNTTPITLPIENPVDPETLTTDSVQLWQVPPFGSEDEEAEATQVELESVEWDADTSQVVVTPAETLPLRTRFVALATKDVKGPEGYSLKLPAPLWMSIQPFDVLKDGMSQVSNISDEDAQSIQALRSFNRPAALAVEEHANIGIEELGALWTWQTWTDSFMVFDPGAGQIPIPNEFARLGENGEVTLPVPDDPIQGALIRELNTRMGFGTTAPGWMPVDGPIQEDTITRESAFLMWFPAQEKYPEDVYDLTYHEDWNQITYTLNKPLNKDDKFAEPGTETDLNIGIVTKEAMGANGHPVQPQPAFVFLTSPEPLIEGDEVQVEQLEGMDLETVRSLERGRQSFNTLITILGAFLNERGLDRTSLALAVAFHPENSTGAAQELRAKALAKLEERSEGGKDARMVDTETWSTVVDPGMGYQGPDGSLDAVDMSNVSRIQWTAEFDTVDFVDGQENLVDYANAQSTPVGISVFLPKRQGASNDISAVCAQTDNMGMGMGKQPFPVVIAQHGLGNWRGGAGMALANSLAEQGLAVVTMDFPGHGGRTPGAMNLHPATEPMGSGESFIGANLVGSKNKWLQAITDTAVLTEIIRSGGLERAIDDDETTDCFVDGPDAEVGYLGNSLGGFVGFVLSSIDPTVNVGVFNGTGGKLSRVLVEGDLGQALASLLPEEGSFERFQSLAFVQWLAEPVDPFAFAPFIQNSPLREVTFAPMMGLDTADRMGANEVLLQMSTGTMGNGDDIVPNGTTELLANAAGLSLDDSTYEASHGFLFQTDPDSEEFAAAECARRQAAHWLFEGLTGMDAPMIPDNLKAQTCVSSN